MDFILAKIKGKRLKKTAYKKIISEQKLFDEIVIHDGACEEYSPDHNLDEDSWFKVDNFSEQTFFPDFLENNFVSAEYDLIKKDEFNKAAFLCSIQNGNYYYQKVTPSLYMVKKMLKFQEFAEIESCENRIIINNTPDAIYFKDKDRLVFRSLPSVSSIFKGIDQLYKEATEDQVEEFLDNDFINLDQSFTKESVSKPNRKRIALAMDTLKTLSENERIELIGYIGDYCGGNLTIDKEEEKVKVSNDVDLKYLLYGIEQRFYTTPFSHEKRVANSVSPI